MKTSYRHNNMRGIGKPLLMIVSLVAVVLVGIDALLGGPVRSVARDSASLVWGSVANVSSAVVGSGFFTSRRSLSEENIALRQRLVSLTALQYENALLSEENAALRELTNAVGAERDGVTAPVLSGGDSSLYGTFLLGAGAEAGLIRGAQVRAAGGVLLGFVSDVSTNTALVQALLAPGVETSAHIGSTTGMTVVGRGGGNGIAIVPREASVSVGDIVYYGDLRSIIGIVGAIESSPSNAEKTIYIRTPQNIFGLRFVTVLPPL